eukprot:CAMPEP_0183360012 /NCGR_PEP_ID=MMETSP0164_2-20130417/54016_1 /TAXON_ID=221442 /ORGANISM="Coccolithus pelagicus ssp braarudi, Strain PLY182g" /LENGTH=68 /DNA_ID=CAMNT_0025534261 /DNA_START=14 /DNA_END=216 /DNA_ORIENTATION=-
MNIDRALGILGGGVSDGKLGAMPDRAPVDAPKERVLSKKELEAIKAKEKEEKKRKKAAAAILAMQGGG